MIEADQREAGKTGLLLEALRPLAMQAPRVSASMHSSGCTKTLNGRTENGFIGGAA